MREGWEIGLLAFFLVEIGPIERKELTMRFIQVELGPFEDGHEMPQVGLGLEYLSTTRGYQE